ncbi:MAG: DEAD/DEAH box helicase [Aquificaceae bacterium]|nr:DEAD/DEAH box helicase [Aquificaceae bacterium]MDW8237016.1 DEAD/DEAH box helicase [Aquificaceae bacterium]
MQFEFESLSKPLRDAISLMGYQKPTPIQREVIPLALQGFDIMGQAQTGTGKTAAFAIPIVEMAKSQDRAIALVMTPTRELSMQVKQEFFALSRFKNLRVYSFYGGTMVQRDLELLSRAIPNIVVGTPGRLKDLIQRNALVLNEIQFLVLDEADMMLDLGFIEDVEWIISKTAKDRQSFLFSATIPKQVQELAKKFLKPEYKFVKVISQELYPMIEERVIKLSSSGQKLTELERLLREYSEERIIVFVKTRKDAKELTNWVRSQGFSAVALHGDMTQKKRENALKLFKEGKTNIVIATDVASRGLDIKNVGLVINFHIPENPEVYIHRIGRTGRIGAKGKAFSLVSPEESKALYRIKKLRQKVSA